MVADGSSKTTICVEEMHKSCSHFASCRPGLDERRAGGWQLAVMRGSVRRWRPMPLRRRAHGEESGRSWKSKGSLPSEPMQRTAHTLPGEPAHSRIACTPLGQPAHWTALARLPFSQGQAAVRTAPPTAIKTKHMTSREWLTERTRFELYKRLRMAAIFSK